MVPAAGGSPHLEACCKALGAEGVETIFVVSEAAPEGVVAVPVSAHSGFAYRANRGMHAAADAGFEHLLLVNDDTRVAPGSVAALRAALDQGLSVAGAVLEEWGGGAVQQAGLRLDEMTARVKAIEAEPEHPIVTVDAVSGAALATTADVWWRLGGFDERFHFYFEDVELCRRARRAGLDVGVVRAARVRHRGGGTRSRHSLEAAFHLGRSHAILARSLDGGPGSKAARLLAVGALGAAWTVRTVGRTGIGPFVRGWADGLID